MSFRQYGGMQFAAKHNIVSSRYNNANTLSVKTVGQPNSFIDFASDISGNYDLSGNVNIYGSLTVENNTQINGNAFVQTFVDASNAIVPKSYIDQYAFTPGQGLNLTDKVLSVNSQLSFVSQIDANNATLTIGTNTSTQEIVIGNSGTMLTIQSGLTELQGGLHVLNGMEIENGVDIQGDVTIQGDLTANLYQSTSDYRAKTNVCPLDLEKYGNAFDALHPVEYTLIESQTHDFGFIAHELQQCLPFLVNGEKDGATMQSIRYQGIIALLVKEVQCLKAQVRDLQLANSTTR